MRQTVKHPILVFFLATFAIFAFQAQAGVITHTPGKISGSDSFRNGLLLAASDQQQQEQNEGSGESTEEEPDCD